MAFYSYIFSANYKRFFKKLNAIAKQEHKFMPFLAVDAGWCVFRHGLALSDYINYKIYRKPASERRRYAGVRKQNSFYEIVSPSAYKERYTIKPRFLKEFAEYTKRDFVQPNAENFDEFAAFLQRHEVFMAKPFDSLCGVGVTKTYTKNIEDPKAYYEHCLQNRIHLEELVIQHPQMSALCPTCVNTMRIMTFNDHGNPRIIWMGLRVGSGSCEVDNFHAMGMGVAIDMESGQLKGEGRNKDNVLFSHHPMTGVKFDGFQIPYFQEAKELALKAALESDKILVVGWDMAISENGPVIIEGNRRPGFNLVQAIDDRGRVDIMEDVLKSLNQ